MAAEGNVSEDDLSGTDTVSRCSSAIAS